MGKVILFGEAMALLIADTTGPLEEIEHFTRAMSGAEVNVSIGLSRLGHKTEYLTRLGDDPFGHYIKDSLEKNGIGTSLITFDDVYRTGIQLKNRTTDGSDPCAPYYCDNHRGRHKLPAVQLWIDRKDSLSLSAREATFRLIDRAKEAGIRVTFDPNLRPALWENEETMRTVINQLSEKADLILPGIAECEILTGSRDFDHIFRFYRDKGIHTVIIKDGSKGAVVNEDGKVTNINFNETACGAATRSEPSRSHIAVTTKGCPHTKNFLLS